MGLAKIDPTDPGATRPHAPVIRDDPTSAALGKLDDTLGSFADVLGSMARTQASFAAVIQGVGRAKALTSSTAIAAIAAALVAWLIVASSTASWRDTAAAEREKQQLEQERQRSLIEDLRADHESEVDRRADDVRELTGAVDRLETNLSKLDAKLDDLPARLAAALAGGSTAP